jgi:hemoglobin
VGGSKAMEIAVEVFYDKVLADDLVGKFFEHVDMEGQRIKQKNFLSMAFGGPYQFSGQDLRKAHGPLIDRLGLNDQHFDRVLHLFSQTLEELNISQKELDGMLEVLQSMRDAVMGR